MIKQDSSYRAAHPFESEPAPFVGSARCAECHRPESQAVLASRHASTFWRPADLVKLPLPKNVFADPGNPRFPINFSKKAMPLRVVTRTKDHIFLRGG